VALASAAALAWAGTARAAEKKPAREVDLGKKRSVSPDASLAGTLESAKAKKPEARGPALDFETFRYQIEVEVSGKRREEIADLKKLIQLGGSPGEMPGWLFRLAELYWEESQYHFFEANRKDDEIIKLGRAAPAAEVERLKGEKRALEERSRGFQSEAIEQYKEIFRKFPKYKRLDEVLFFLGENLSRQGKQKEALGAYKVLVTRFEKSRYVPDAWMAFGEFYFNSADKGKRNEALGNALKAYKRAASYTESTVYGYALYKQAWVYYNLARWSEALDLFRAVIIFGDLPTSTIAADKKLALVKEARKDYVRTYSHVGAPETAAEEFKRVGGEAGWFDMLRSLAGLYYDEGKDREAILVYHQLIQAKPLSPESPLFQSRIVTCAGRMGKKEFAVQQARVFVKMLKEIEASNTVTDEKGKKQLEEARGSAENTLRTLAVQYHNEYKKTRDEPVAGLAAEVYEDYLAIFPDTFHAYEMRFFFAELLFVLEKYPRAGEEYTRVAVADAKAVDGKQKPGKYLQDALENAVFAYDIVAKKFEETEKRAPSDPKQRQQIPKAKQQLLEACQRYVKYAPKGDKYVGVSYKAANIYYRYNWFAEATNLFTEIALDHPRDEVAGYATNLVLDAYNLLGDWRNVNGWAKRFYANVELVKAHPQLKDDLARIIEQSSFKVIEEYERAKNHRKAAEAYLAFVREWPASKLAPTALYNASVDWANARQVDRAVQVREQLVERYPADPLVAKCIYANGADYEAMADFEKAAAHYERYFEEWRKSKGAAPRAKARKGRRPARPEPAPAAPGLYDEQKAQDALYDAGVFREGLRDWRRAEADRAAWLATWPDAKEAPKVFLSVADLYSKEKATSKELKQLEEYQKRYARDPTEWLVVQHRIARLLEKAGNAAGARRAYEQAVLYHRAKKAQVAERGMPVVAQGMFLELEPDFDRYDRITLDVKPKLLKAQLEVKGKKLVELQQKYTAVVNLKQAEPAVCALYRIGLAYKRFAQTLYDAPIPKELKALKRQDVIDEYKAQLSQLAAAPEQKAVEGLEYAMTKSREYGVSNDCSRRAAEILVKYKPEKYGAPQELVPALVAKVPGSREGHGLLSALQAPGAAAVAEESAAAALPPLATPRPDARRAEAPAAAPPVEDDADRPLPKASGRKLPAPARPPAETDDKDEDLLE
jgi:tetratricopeptide (TPR) repeat protein